MGRKTEMILRIPDSVKEEMLNYRGRVEAFLRGEISPVSFRAYRVPMGVYEQRMAGKYMVRIRVGAGLALPSQLERIAQLAKRYGNDILHVTTRQDIQIHDVDIEDTPDVMEGLLEAGLSPRGGGGNTVRNITACPEAGVCSEEVFDVAPYAIAMAEYLLQDKSSFNLPRKFKVVFSGCSKDCAFASVADLGFFAHLKDGVKGFAVFAGGGLGANPAVATRIEEFVEASQIFEVAEAVKKLFDTYGDRTNKHKARLRYVVARFGPGMFLKLYQTERELVRSGGLPYQPPIIRSTGDLYPPPESSVTIRLRLKHGDIPVEDLAAVGRIASRYGQGLVRTTQLQDLLITGVTPGDVETVNRELKQLSINVFADGAPKIVACAGASTCKLGLCLSRGLADAVAEKLRPHGLAETVIRISGCPNSCGHHYIGQVGFQGKARRINGRLMPFYDVFVGANIVEGEAQLAKKVGTVPARQVPDLLERVVADGVLDAAKLEELAGKCSELPDELEDEYYYDWGSEEVFSLAGRGPGECGAGVVDVIRLDIDEAKDALRDESRDNEGVYRAVVAAARALLVIFGLEPKKDREVFAAFREHLIEPGWVKPETQELIDQALDWRLGDKESIEQLRQEAEELVGRIEELFLSLDANLRFRAKPVASKKTVTAGKADSNVIDLRGVACPLNFVKAKLELEKLKVGDVLEVLLDEGEPVRNAPASFAEQGHEVLEVKNVGDYYRVKVRRKK